MLHGTFRYLALERVHYGKPARQAVAEEAEARHAARVVVVTSRSLNRNTTLVSDAIAALGSRVVHVFDECVEHTPRESALKLAGVLRDNGADLVVTIGGGTAIDTVKVALICLAEEVRSIESFDRCHVRVDADGRRTVPDLAAPPCRQIAVPTTLSGAEFSDLAGCTDLRSGQKHHYTAGLIGPAAVILDPAMTLHTPESLWLSTGIRALDHAIESLCSIEPQPLTDATSLRGVELLARGLPRSQTAPDDLDARLDCQLAVWLTSTGINRVPYGASHGIGHVLGATAGVPHGITSCVLLPAVLRYNVEATRTAQRQLARALGDEHAEPAALVAALVAGLGLPARLRDVNVRRDQFADIAAKALRNPWVRTNPRPIDRPEHVMEILEAAW
ncbi:alcohol dehydrogenase class IV [Cupriavidus gilardii J11]|uniref:Alcohol dehydrogenase class IV n=1 Tax=Cupriavidus gilardii J11 TaxID=936133 RepID=A0A562BKJ5_9BURK|nr:iron-containing alcohol dehydrogenase [Cupriavidus gilardii]TWG85601.1 alcohol dehydrogenase class IV [Cupriavidus gilardii J11]